MPLAVPAKEADLYEPIAGLLRSLGYQVLGEVEHCDIAARRGEELVVVELKRTLSLPLLIQALKRQKFADAVFVGLPMLPRGRWGKPWREMTMLLKRLDLGLITVDFRPGRREAAAEPAAVLEFGPRPGQAQAARKAAGKKPTGRAAQRRKAVLKEMDGRTGDRNPGGRSTAEGAVITAYREQAVHIACLMERFGPLSPAQVRRLGGSERAGTLLRSDVYGWFCRVEHGIYELKEPGSRYLEENPELAAVYRSKAREAEA